MDWKKCILCQTVTKEKLQCPTDSKRTNVGAGYASLSHAIKCFRKLQSLPLDINMSLCEDENLFETLKKENAKWHKSYRNKFGNMKLRRAEKRKSPNDENKNTKIPRLSSTSGKCDRPAECFFCNDTFGNLTKVSTLGLDSNVKKCAEIINDHMLLAKLSAGDMIALKASYHVKCLSSLVIHVYYGIISNNITYKIMSCKTMVYYIILWQFSVTPFD